jgi:hypothetical protein
MRKVSYYETDEENQKGFHYTLTVESEDLSEGFRIDGRLFGESVETIFCEPIHTENEKAGIFDMMRALYWKIKEIPELDQLHRRMHTLAWADYDSERDEDDVKLPASFYRLGMILAEEKAERDNKADYLIHELDGLRRGMVASWIEELSHGVDPDPVVDPFFVPSAGPQMDLFGCGV